MKEPVNSFNASIVYPLGEVVNHVIDCKTVRRFFSKLEVFTEIGGAGATNKDEFLPGNDERCLRYYISPYVNQVVVRVGYFLEHGLEAPGEREGLGFRIPEHSKLQEGDRIGFPGGLRVHRFQAIFEKVRKGKFTVLHSMVSVRRK